MILHGDSMTEVAFILAGWFVIGIAIWFLIDVIKGVLKK